MASQEWYRSWRDAGYSSLIFCQHCVAELPSPAWGGVFDGPKTLPFPGERQALICIGMGRGDVRNANLPISVMQGDLLGLCAPCPGNQRRECYGQERSRTIVPSESGLVGAEGHGSAATGPNDWVYLNDAGETEYAPDVYGHEATGLDDF